MFLSIRSHYDYQEESLIFIAPGQLAGFEEEETMIQPNGWALAFHPDFIRGTSLGRNMKDYNYFSYNIREALHVSERKKEILLESFRKIKYELGHPIDKHSRKLIISNIELLLTIANVFMTASLLPENRLTKTSLPDLKNC